MIAGIGVDVVPFDRVRRMVDRYGPRFLDRVFTAVEKRHCLENADPVPNLAGRIAAHRVCMLLMLATTSGAVFFRVFLALWALTAQGRHFEAFYACNAWIGWLLPLGLTALWLRNGARQTEARTPFARAV